MFTYGIITAWFYLRFLQAHVRHSNTASSGTSNSSVKTVTHGDLSESFAFDTLFPTIIRPPMTLLSNIIFQIFVAMKCCSKIVRQDYSANGTVKGSYQYRPLIQDDTVQNI